MKQGQNQSNNQSNEGLNPIIAMTLSLCFCAVFLVLGYKVNPVMYIFGVCSAAIAGECWSNRNK